MSIDVHHLFFVTLKIEHFLYEIIFDFDISVERITFYIEFCIHFLPISILLFSVYAEDDCDKDGTTCTNGACLDSLCHCNDGYGGCNCQVPGKIFHSFSFLSFFFILRRTFFTLSRSIKRLLH